MDKTKKPLRPLPTGITPADFEFARYEERATLPDDRYEDHSFELWLVSSFGWVIPTLAIAAKGQRTYAVCTGEGATDRRVKRGAQARVGRGPHVLEQRIVYVRKTTLKALQPFLDLRREGAVEANETRDRISSRRAQGVRERAAGRYSWRWDV